MEESNIVYIQMSEEDIEEGRFWVRKLQTYEYCVASSIGKEKEGWREKLEKTKKAYTVYHEYVTIKYSPDGYLTQKEVLAPVINYYSKTAKFIFGNLEDKNILKL